MGAIKQWTSKLMGTDVAADIAERQGEEQAATTRKAAESAARNAQEAAAQSVRMIEQQAARSAAEGAAADALSKPLEVADVALGGVDTGQSVSAAARKRRQTFGVGSSSGVNI